MTVKIVGVWELGWSTPIMEYDLWNFPLRDFVVDEWCMTPISGIKAKGIVERANIGSYLKENADLTPIYVDEKGEEDLETFNHPNNCLYIFGKAAYSPWVSKGSPSGSSVRIVTPLNAGLLWPHQCAAIVLLDRTRKA